MHSFYVRQFGQNLATCDIYTAVIYNFRIICAHVVVCVYRVFVLGKMLSSAKCTICLCPCDFFKIACQFQSITVFRNFSVKCKESEYTNMCGMSYVCVCIISE